MKGLFNYEGPVMSAMSRLADLIWLNILTLICCIPVVTAGAALCTGILFRKRDNKN